MSAAKGIRHWAASFQVETLSKPLQSCRALKGVFFFFFFFGGGGGGTCGSFKGA